MRVSPIKTFAFRVPKAGLALFWQPAVWPAKKAGKAGHGRGIQIKKH
jgi:hypothetical protein